MCIATMYQCQSDSQVCMHMSFQESNDGGCMCRNVIVKKLHMTDKEMASYKHAKKIAVKQIQASRPRPVADANGASMYCAPCTVISLE